MSSTIADLKRGQRGIIKEFSVDIIPLKLLEMGCLPGNEVELVQTAPFKDPIYLNINGSHLAIRKETAQNIQIDIIP
ncbi:FeoA family protein [Salinimicrobium flavum]|uniref:Ferrous iron transport protein A n=1 Tax=Salinimicrobium flavum TaxID=1737065 RepID=A0ABW5IZ63_9FLAO